ncbi:type iib dna topoisomerase [Toxoplasma gondii RUB]|uniref:DNA topoisomerase (ATP-hydrolyzing) n=5 Tax=Toxoplasma gondii TaxID=5811 RepID=A0A086LT05_TOXGO|nr:type iib dna topoisomerase [Toxoplasma gondii p89]KFG59773.1 type iib dna topoisomerase [Toxoplasma gondii RUB]KFH04351.1 type iib dna topoisomerase [Toxoplasma gondii VAND]KFH14829.1 type iib dna topoisomerase [Toxoplasma gondii MAS]PUA87167.1 type iib dna topoisomerase [Toxoplasma gondii TgCATBr9]
MAGSESDVVTRLEEAILSLIRWVAVSDVFGPDSCQWISGQFSFRKARTVARWVVMMKQIIMLIQMKTHATIRELFYSSIRTYSTQVVTNRILAKVTQFLGVPRETLHVFSPSKTLVRGPFLLTEISYSADVEVDCNNVFETRGHQLSSFGVSRITCYAKPNFILVVEKETAFQHLLAANFIHCLYPCVIMTARGFPDLASRKLIHLMNCHLNGRTRLFCLCDYDPHGLAIAMTFAFGGEQNKQKYYTEDCAIPQMEPLLLPEPKEAVSKGIIREEDTKSMTPLDLHLLQTLHNRLKHLEQQFPSQLHASWRKSLESMLHNRVKYELDAFSDLPEVVGSIISVTVSLP